jgi:hypothetical protein
MPKEIKTMNKTDKFKSLLHKLIKEELEAGEEKPQGFEKINYDLVLEPADLQSALSALSDIKNYGIYANNLRDPKIIQKIFGPSIPAQKANTAWRTWDTLNDEERFAKATDIRNRVPEDWKKLETELADKYDQWQTENGDGSFVEFISTLKSTDLRNVKSNGFFGSRGANYYPIKTPDNLKKYSGVMTKDKDYIVSGDKIIFPQKTNPFETKDYLTKVLKTIMGNAKLQYNLAQKEADDQPTTTSNTQGAIEKINFVKTFDSPELAKKFMRLIPKDFAPKTDIVDTKVSVLDITDPQKKNLMATALKFISDNTKKPVKESVKDFFKDPMQAADVRGWIKNPKLSDSEKREKIKSVMKDPSKFNDLMDEFTDELKIFKKPVKESLTGGYPHKRTSGVDFEKIEITEPMDDDTKNRFINRFRDAGWDAKPNNIGGITAVKKANIKESIKDQVHRLIKEVLDEKKLTTKEKNKKEDIVLGLKKSGFKKDDPTLYAIATAKAKKLAEKKFPDLTGDGKVTKADILKGRGIELKEEEDVVDTVTLDIPLFIRMLEYAKEDAQTDMDLHDVAEKAIALNKSKEMLSMEDYNSIIGDSNEELNENEEDVVLLPQSSLTKANSVVTDVKTLAKILKGIYTQIQSKETIDFSKNQNIKYALQYLDKAIGEKNVAPQSKI